MLFFLCFFFLLKRVEDIYLIESEYKISVYTINKYYYTFFVNYNQFILDDILFD